MNHRDTSWLREVREFAPAQQRHDRSLLKRYLPTKPSPVKNRQPSVVWQLQSKQYCAHVQVLSACASVRRGIRLPKL